MTSEEPDAFPELSLQTSPNSRQRSEVMSQCDSRPPSYYTVSNSSLAGQETARKARAAQYAQNTDCKSLVSTGDRPSVDETQLKSLVTTRGEIHQPQDDPSGNDGRPTDDNDDEFSIYCDASSGSMMYQDLLRAIEDLQQRQASISALHAEHDRKLEELLRQQPEVKKQFNFIRKNSIQSSEKNSRTCGNTNGARVHDENSSNSNNSNNSTNNSSNDNNSTNNSSNDNNSTNSISINSNSNSSTNNSSYETGNENSGSENSSSHSNNAEYVNSNVASTPIDGATPSPDQVTHRKPSKGGVRDDIDLGAFQRFLFSKEQNHIYVQIERLYSNFRRLHIPSKTVQTLLEGNEMLEPTRLQVPSDHVIPSEQTKNDEETKLSRENEELKQKIEDLQKELEQAKREKEAAAARRIPPRLPPKPSFHSTNNASRGRPKLQNTKLHARQLGFVSGRPTSPKPPLVRPVDIDIREISIQHKIENYRQKFHHEVLHEGSKQTSSPFYTTHGGCRAQLEVFLDGNGTGRGRCMSLFVRVIPGEFDDFIKWPITLHIRATLINQNRGLSHSVEDSGNQFQFFKPGTVRDSESDNNCWGLVEFVDHKMISQPGFIKDDTVVLRCKITLSSSLS